MVGSRVPQAKHEDSSRRAGLSFLILAIGVDLLLAVTGHTAVIRIGYGIVAILMAIGCLLGYRQSKKKTATRSKARQVP